MMHIDKLIQHIKWEKLINYLGFESLDSFDVYLCDKSSKDAFLFYLINNKTNDSYLYMLEMVDNVLFGKKLVNEYYIESTESFSTIETPNMKVLLVNCCSKDNHNMSFVHTFYHHNKESFLQKLEKATLI